VYILVFWSRASVCLPVCVSVPCRIPALCADPGVTWGNGRECPLVVHCWADLQSVHTVRVSLLRQHSAHAKCQRVLVLALCLVIVSKTSPVWNPHLTKDSDAVLMLHYILQSDSRVHFLPRDAMLARY